MAALIGVSVGLVTKILHHRIGGDTDLMLDFLYYFWRKGFLHNGAVSAPADSKISTQKACGILVWGPGVLTCYRGGAGWVGSELGREGIGAACCPTW